MAFMSGDLTFKFAVNNYVPLFYIFFLLSGIVLAFLVTKFILDKNIVSENSKYISLVILKLAIATYAVFLTLMSVSRFMNYRSEAIDVMFFKAELWQLSQFQIPSFAWSQHFSPILVFLVPFFWITKSGTFLIFIQSAFVVSAAIPIYLSAKKKLKSEFIGLSISLAFLTFGGLQVGFAYGFHEIMFLPTLFLWMYYFYISKRLTLYIIFAFLCLTVKEEVSFMLIFWGLYLLFKRDYKYALSTMFLGFIWYLLTFQYIFPHFNKGGGYGYWGQFPTSKYNGLLGIIIFGLQNPVEFTKNILTPNYKLATIFHSYGNFSFLSFLYPPSLIITIPSIAQKLLSSDIAAKNGFHYSSAITAVVIISIIEAIKFIKDKKNILKPFKNKHAFLGILIIFTAVCANILYGYHPLSPLLLGKENGLSDYQVNELNEAINSIPPQNTVAAQYYIRSRINKPYWMTSDGPLENETADYVIIHLDLPMVMAEKQILEKNVGILSKNKNYEIVVNSSYGTILFRKKK
jgi:uncharacterized membrane protein